MAEVLVGLFTMSLASGVIPLINAELLVLAAATAVPSAGLPLVVVAGTAGQMLSKVILFVLAREAPERLPKRVRARLSRATTSLETKGAVTGSLIFASAATGLPPFYGVSLGAGVLGVELQSFVLAGTSGRLIRFGVLAGLGGVAA